MIQVFQSDSLAATFKCVAINSANRLLITDNLCWKVSELDNNENPIAIHDSQEAQPRFDLQPGTYHIQATFEGESVDLGTIELKKRTLTHAAYLIGKSTFFNDNAHFHAETDAFIEHERRSADRQNQAIIGTHIGPVKDPFANKEGGTQLKGHPLLNNAQFDGMPPEITSDPTQNEEATNKMEYQLKQTHDLQHGAKSSNNPTPF